MSSTDNEMFVTERPRNPFAPPAGQEIATRQAPSLGALASAEQQKALGELQAQIMLARMNPRDPQQAVDNILRDCSRVTLASVSQYEYARGGTDIRGPSIKLLEAIARRWGNIHSGFKIVHTEGNASDVVTYAWDLETGYKDDRQFQVRHIRDTRSGPVKVTDERDIYELIANSAQRRKRSCLQAVIPSDVIDAAVEQCQETMSANVDTSVQGLKTLLKAFAEFGVTQAQIEQRIQCKLEAISPGQVMQLSRIYTSMHDGISVPSQWFRAVDPPRPTRQSPAAKQPAQTPPAQDASQVKGDKSETPTQAQQPAQEPPQTPPPTPPTPTPPPAETPPAEPEPPPAAASETSQEQFDYVVLDHTGEPVDGEAHLDPLTWAQQFLALMARTGVTDRNNLLFHNAEALHDAAAMSPEADALLDTLDEEDDEPETGELPAADPEETTDPDEKIVAHILQHLPTLTTGQEVIAYSKTPAVMAPIQRWQKDGRDGLVLSVKSAFTTRLERLRSGGA
jgi:hypothetical protein